LLKKVFLLLEKNNQSFLGMQLVSKKQNPASLRQGFLKTNRLFMTVYKWLR